MSTHYFQSQLLHTDVSVENQTDVLDRIQAQCQKISAGQNIRVLPSIILNDLETPVNIAMVRDFIYELSFAVPETNVRSYVLFNIGTASIAAQNALLKILEEPPPNTAIFLTTSNPQTVVPTIVSRCKLTRIDDLDDGTTANADEITSLFEKIVTAQAYSDLMTVCESAKDKSEALALLRSLITNIYTRHLKPEYNQFTIKALQKIHEAVGQLEKNCNVKLTLENCFFSIHSYKQQP